MIRGAWQTNPQPKLPKSIKEYNSAFRFGFQFKGFKFLCDILVDKITKEYCFYIYPYYKEFKNNIIVFSDEIRISKYWFRNIYNMNINNDKLKNLLYNFNEGKIFYSDDLCGTDFKQVIDFSIKK